MLRHPSLILAASALLLLSVPARGSAQNPVDVQAPSDPPAHVSVVDGTAAIDREGRSEPAVPSMPLIEGDRLRTDRGRVEVLFPDASYLHVDQFATVDMLTGSLLRLLTGRIVVGAAGAPGSAAFMDFQVDTPAGAVRIMSPGEYRVSLFSGPELELAVVRGQASVTTSAGSVPVRSGERVFAREGERPSAPGSFNSARWDAFDRWSQDQRQARVGNASAEYLPEELDNYSYVFDRYGGWRDVAPYGRVWYPSVAIGWRPYYRGSWRTFSTWGEFWIGDDPWDWPTHHYGRWGYDDGWFWIPRRGFGPAWVAWALSPGYMSWCPLGWDHRPVIDIFIGGRAYGRGYDPWRAWTVAPRHAFGNGRRVSTYAIAGGALGEGVRSSFVMQRGAPSFGAAARLGSGTTVGYAVPRGRGIGALGGGRPVGGSMERSLRQPGAAVTGGTMGGPGERSFGTSRPGMARPEGARTGGSPRESATSTPSLGDLGRERSQGARGSDVRAPSGASVGGSRRYTNDDLARFPRGNSRGESTEPSLGRPNGARPRGSEAPAYSNPGRDSAATPYGARPRGSEAPAYSNPGRDSSASPYGARPRGSEAPAYSNPGRDSSASPYGARPRGSEAPAYSNPSRDSSASPYGARPRGSEAPAYSNPGRDSAATPYGARPRGSDVAPSAPDRAWTPRESPRTTPDRSYSPSDAPRRAPNRSWTPREAPSRESGASSPSYAPREAPSRPRGGESIRSAPSAPRSTPRSSPRASGGSRGSSGSSGGRPRPRGPGKE